MTPKEMLERMAKTVWPMWCNLPDNTKQGRLLSLQAALRELVKITREENTDGVLDHFDLGWNVSSIVEAKL